MAKSEEISFTSAHEIKADRRILKTKKAIYEAHFTHIIQLSMMFLMKELMSL